MKAEDKTAEDWLETYPFDKAELSPTDPVPYPTIIYSAVRYLLIQEKIRQDKAHEAAYYDDNKRCGDGCCNDDY